MPLKEKPDKITRDSFVFYRSWWDAIGCLPRDVRLDVYEAIVSYCFGETPTEEQLKPTARALLILIKPQIDANYEKYLNGLRGGRGNRKSDDESKVTELEETKAKPNANQTETKAKPNPNQSKTKAEPIMINDKCNIIKKSTDVDTKSPPPTSAGDSYVYRDITDIVAELKAETGWLDQVAMLCNSTAAEATAAMDTFLAQCVADCNTTRTKQDVRKHFRYWLDKHVKSTNHANNQSQTRTGGARSKLAPPPGCGLIEDD
jgi:hypothetical protein